MPTRVVRKRTKAAKDSKKISRYEKRLRKEHLALKTPKAKPNPQNAPKQLIEYRDELQSNPTYYESKFRAALNLAKIRHRFQVPFFDDTFRCIVDFVIGDMAVEVDGKHHSDPDQVEKDNYRAKWLLMNRAIYTIRFTNKEVKDDATACLLKLKQFSKEDFKKGILKNVALGMYTSQRP